MIRFLQTPGPLQKALLVGFLAVICIMMVVTLVPGGILNEFGLGHAGLIAKVGSQEITAQDVSFQADQIGRGQFPRGIPPQIRPYLMQQATESLLMQALLVNEAEHLGLRASDEELRYELQHGPFSAQLFPDDKFIGADQYRAFVEANFRMNVPQFEQRVKKQLAINKVRSVIEGASDISPAEMLDQYRAGNTKIKFDYAALSLPEIAKQLKPTDSELRAYYEKNKQQFVNSIPEKRKAAYIAINTSSLPDPPKVTTEEMQSYYKSHQDEFRVPESVTVRHILIRTPTPGPDSKVDPKAVADARAKAEEILKQFKAGADFATLAKKDSQDPASAAKGGLLGPITRGRTVPEFEKTAFATPKGQTSGIIQTDYGFHILHVDDKTEAHLKSFEEVKPEIEARLAQDKNKTAAETLSRTVETEARTSGMEKAAKAHGLQVVNTGYFARTDTVPGIGSAPGFMDAVFGNKPMSPPVAVPTTQGYAIVQVSDVKPAATPTFEEVKDRIDQQFRTERAQSVMEQKTRELADRAHAEHNLRAAAKELGIPVRTSELVSVDSQVPEIGTLTGNVQQIFTLKTGETSGAITTNRGGLVVTLLEKQEPSMADFEKQKGDLRQQLVQQKQVQTFQLYLDNLRNTAEKKGVVKVYQKELNRMLTTVKE